MRRFFLLATALIGIVAVTPTAATAQGPCMYCQPNMLCYWGGSIGALDCWPNPPTFCWMDRQCGVTFAEPAPDGSVPRRDVASAVFSSPLSRTAEYSVGIELAFSTLAPDSSLTAGIALFDISSGLNERDCRGFVTA